MDGNGWSLGVFVVAVDNKLLLVVSTISTRKADDPMIISLLINFVLTPLVTVLYQFNWDLFWHKLKHNNFLRHFLMQITH